MFLSILNIYIKKPNIYILHMLMFLLGKIPRNTDGWILGNVDYQGFYRVNYEPAMWRKLADQLNADHQVSILL